MQIQHFFITKFANTTFLSQPLCDLFWDFLHSPNGCQLLPHCPENIEGAAECAAEDAKVKRPACIQQLQDESEPIDDTEDVDKLPKRHVVDEIDSALNDIMVENLQRHDGDKVLGVLPGD